MSKFVLSFRAATDRQPDADQETAWTKWFEQIGGSVAEWGHRVGQVRGLGTAKGSSGALAGYLVTKRGLSHALIEAIGIESELISSCWMTMRQTTERLLANAQEAGVIRTDVDATDVMRLVHGVTVSTEKAPERSDMLLSVMLDGLRATRP